MSQHQDDFYRGDPPTGSTAAGRGPDPARTTAGSATPPGHVPPPGHGPHPGYAPQPGHAPQPGYGPAGYGPPPGYGPPEQGYPPYGPQGWGPGWRRPTNTLAVLALVMAFVFAPAGLVLGVLARRQIKETGEDGDGLALAGMIVGGIATALFALVIVFWVIAFASFTTSDGFAP